jgi:anaerobic selenocysteine-containing dehydrogenase
VLAAGYPERVPATTVDRQCGSTQQAIHFAAQGVLAGAYDVVVAGGVESMSHVPMGSNVAFSLVNGQRRAHNANQILRPPAWRKSDPDGALCIHPSDLADLGLEAGDWVAVVTPTGRIVVRAEVDESMRRHQVALPHGFGMSYPDGKGGRVVNGPRINQITASGDRDPIAGTPHHKDVRVRLEAAHPDEAATAEDASARIHDLIGAGTPS